LITIESGSSRSIFPKRLFVNFDDRDTSTNPARRIDLELRPGKQNRLPRYYKAPLYYSTANREGRVVLQQQPKPLVDSVGKAETEVAGAKQIRTGEALLLYRRIRFFFVEKYPRRH
jgi:hypothetical protein